MLKLIKLEIKKYKMTRYIRTAFITSLIIVLALVIGFYSSYYDDSSFLTSYGEVFYAIDVLNKTVFIIVAASLLAKLVINEYKSKTITVLFMYPVKRKELIAAKLIIVSVFTFASIVLSDIFSSSLFVLLNKVFNFVPDTFAGISFEQLLASFLLSAVTAAGMSLITLYFGMRKKSTTATIVSGVIMVSFISSGSGNFSLGSILAIPIGLALLGVFVAYMTIRNIEHVDIG